jgi:molecular chaperone DnaK
VGRRVGIDLGTTNSVVAIVDGPQPRILDSKENRPQTRSIVGLRRRRGSTTTELLVGDPAVDNWALAPEDTVVSIKRLMGRGVGDPEVQRVRQWVSYPIVEPTDGTRESVRVVIGDTQYSPIDLSALILRKLKGDAEYHLGDEVTHAVITVPAYFSQIQRDATRKAGLQAGLQVIKILEEPAAAAIAYGLDAEDSGEAKTILVYDLGGGTFDISILTMAAGTFVTRNLEGDMWLGGDDFDQVLVQRAIDYVQHEFGLDPQSETTFMVELKKAAQSVKERLSSSHSADLIVAGRLRDNGNLVDVELEVGRDEYERLIDPLVQRTVRIVEKALRNASLEPAQIDNVLMAGNASSLPLVQKAMEDIFGPAKILRRVHPKQCVAIGAAIVAAYLGGRIVCGAPDPQDPLRECGHVNAEGAEACAACGAPLVLEPEAEAAPALGALILGAPFHYGAQTAGDRFTVFIRKGDPYPTADPETQVFYTRAPNSRMISIPIYGGDELARASANELQGQAFAILPPGLPAETPIRVKLWLDGDGVFKLAAHLEDGRDLKPWVVAKGEAEERAVRELDEAERVLGERAYLASADLMARVEEARAQIFEHMGRGEFGDALEEIERLRAAVEGIGREKVDVAKKAEMLVGFANVVVGQYGWALEPGRAARLNDLVEETRRAQRRGEPAALEDAAARLDAATDDLPEMVQVLLGMRAAIAGRIDPYDPTVAGRLQAEVGAVEDAIARGDPSAHPRFEAVAEEIVRALPEPPGGFKCSNGHVYPPGVRHCPECGEDRLLAAGPEAALGVAS